MPMLADAQKCIFALHDVYHKDVYVAISGFHIAVICCFGIYNSPLYENRSKGINHK